MFEQCLKQENMERDKVKLYIKYLVTLSPQKTSPQSGILTGTFKLDVNTYKDLQRTHTPKKKKSNNINNNLKIQWLEIG